MPQKTCFRLFIMPRPGGAEASKMRFCKSLKIRCHFVAKIQGTYFKISALYFKIYGLYFLRHALCFFSLRGSVEKMRGKMFCAMRLSLKNIVSNFSVCQVILMKKCELQYIG